MKKAPQAKILVIGTVFTPKIAQKCKKWPTENLPPPRWEGTENVFNFENPPLAGGITENPPHQGGFTPALKIGHRGF